MSTPPPTPNWRRRADTDGEIDDAHDDADNVNNSDVDDAYDDANADADDAPSSLLSGQSNMTL